MSGNEQKLFLSYAWADDQRFVERLYADLKSRGHDPWMDKENMPSRGRTLPQEVIKNINDSDRVIAVIGPAALRSEACQGEREYAFSTGKVVTAILRCGDYRSLPLELSKYFVPDFRDTRPYEAALEEFLRLLADPPAVSGPLFDVPALPPHFQHRPEDLRALREIVTTKELKPVAITSAGHVALQGMGGVGKTVLAAALARDYTVRRTFQDGIIWLMVGRHANLLTLLAKAGMSLGDDPGEYTDLNGARIKLSQSLQNKECLLVLDDVWKASDAEPFINTLGPLSRLLITTRDHGIANAMGAQVHYLEVLADQEALELLARWSGQDAIALGPEAREVAQECGNLPLALAMIGAMVGKDPRHWKNVVHKLRSAEIAKIRQEFPNYPYPDLMQAIQVSVEAMDQLLQDRYLDFAVFSEDTSVPEAVFETLWAPLGWTKYETEDALDLFVRLSLARRDDEDEGRITLHDLQFDYVRRKVSDLDLITLHDRLLGAYRASCHDGWHTGLNDGYFYQHLAYHLMEAGRADEVSRLLRDPNWLQAKLNVAGVTALIEDYRFMPEDEDLRLLQGAIRLSANILSRDTAQLRTQIYGRLLPHESLQIKSLLDEIKHSADGAWLRLLSPSLTPPGGPLLRSFEGHSEEVYTVAVTPDGRWAVSGSCDYSIKLWDLRIGVELDTFSGHEGWVLAVAVTPDGCRAVSGSYDQTIRVWDLQSRTQTSVLAGHTGGVHAIAITPDGRRAISGSEDCTLKVWNLDTAAEERTLSGHTDWIRAVTVTPDGRRVVSASDDYTVRVWDLETGDLQLTLEGHKHFVLSVAVTPDADRIVSCSNDRHIIIWNLQLGIEERRLLASSPVVTVRVTPDGRQIVAGLWDHTVRVWNFELGTEEFTLRGHTGAVNAIAITPDSQYAVSASADKNLKLWHLTCETNTVLTQHANRAGQVVLTPDGRRVVFGSPDNTLKVWNLQTLSEEYTLTGLTDSLSALAVTPDGRWAISGSGDGTLRVWDLDRGTEAYSMIGHELGGANPIAVTPDGCRAISGSQDKVLKVWDLECGIEQHTLRMHKDFVWSMALTPDGRYVVSGAVDNDIKVWELETGTELHTLSGHTDSVYAVTITPDGSRIISGSRDGTLKVWRLDSGEEEYSLRGHTRWVEEVVVAPNGRVAVSGARDGELKVWDLQNGVELLSLLGHSDAISRITITPDGRYVISISWDGSIKVWNLNDGQLITSFTGDSGIFSSALAADGLMIVAVEFSGRLHFLRLENIVPGPHIVTALRSLTDGTCAFGCPQCRAWCKIEHLMTEVELACAECSTPIRLNAFVVNADWKPVAAAWRNTCVGKSLKMPRPKIPTGKFVLWAEGRMKSSVGKTWVDLGRGINASARATQKQRIQIPTPHPGADPERAVQLNAQYVEAMRRWKELPWWKRVRTKKPERPTGI